MYAERQVETPAFLRRGKVEDMVLAGLEPLAQNADRGQAAATAAALPRLFSKSVYAQAVGNLS